MGYFFKKKSIEVKNHYRCLNLLIIEKKELDRQLLKFNKEKKNLVRIFYMKLRH